MLTVLNGRFISGVKIPFLYDLEVHVRLLVSLPLLIAAEVIVHNRLKAILRQFLERQIVTAALETRFESIIESALRLRNSKAVELGLIILVLLTTGLAWRTFLAMQSDTWYATNTSGGGVKTPAGYWYQFVSVPVVQFIALRWYFAGLRLGEAPLADFKTRPEPCPNASRRIMRPGFSRWNRRGDGAHSAGPSCLLSGYVANRILHEGAKLPDHYAEIGVLALFMLLLALGPLCVFTPSLLRAKRLGLHHYGRLASDYVVGFDRKWIRRPTSSGGATGRYRRHPVASRPCEQLRRGPVDHSIPLRKKLPFGLAVIVAVPLLPLSLTMFSLQEIAIRLLKILL